MLIQLGRRNSRTVPGSSWTTPSPSLNVTYDGSRPIPPPAIRRTCLPAPQCAYTDLFACSALLPPCSYRYHPSSEWPCVELPPAFGGERSWEKVGKICLTARRPPLLQCRHFENAQFLKKWCGCVPSHARVGTSDPADPPGPLSFGPGYVDYSPGVRLPPGLTVGTGGLSSPRPPPLPRPPPPAQSKPRPAPAVR